MVYTLKELVNIKYGKNQKDVENPNGKYPIYGTGGLMSYADKYLYDKPSVLIGRKGSISKVRFSEKPFWTVDTLFYTEVNEDIVIPKYLYYKMLTMDMSDYNEGTTIPSLRTDTLYRIELDIPDKVIQKKVINILESLDKKIELNNKINNNLYKLVENNYESLINDCDWEEVELGTVSNITSGKRPIDKSEIGKYPVIGANGVMAYTSDYNFNEDLIITGRVGTLGVVKRYLDKIWASDNTLVIQTKYVNYIENYLKTIDYYSLNRGSTQPLLTQGDLKKQIICFNEELVTKFEKDNQIFVDKIRNNEKENSRLIELKDTLLPKLVNGEIDVDDIEI